MKMKEIFFSDRQDREIRCCMLLMEFMLKLLEYRKELAPEVGEEDPYGYADDVMKRMISVTDYIKNNLTADDLSQGAMAEMAGISRDCQKISHGKTDYNKQTEITYSTMKQYQFI